MHDRVKPRHMYTVVDEYEKGKERWLTLQKRESQFRAKKYQLKADEIIKIPGQAKVHEENDIKEDI